METQYSVCFPRQLAQGSVLSVGTLVLELMYLKAQTTYMPSTFAVPDWRTPPSLAAFLLP